MTTKIEFGTISHGTLRTEDLLRAFADELTFLSRDLAAKMANGKVPYDQSQLDGYDKLVNVANETDPDNEYAPELVGKLMDALNEFCPSYVYFGAHEGDGSDFGFWPCIDALEDAVRDGEVLKLNDGDEIPADYTGEVMFVTDHDNVSFGYVDETSREFVEVWGCV